MKKYWIEVIRVLATLAVVLLHISSTVIDNNTILEIGNVNNYIILDSLQLVCRWAVPCFIMITGALLLNPNKYMDIKKILKYISRIVIILATFGTLYSFLELFFYNRTINKNMIILAILNVIQGKSWSHMWYLYTLMGLYICTPFLRILVKKLSEKKMAVFIVILFCGTIGINTLSYILNLNIKNNFMMLTYIVYYLLGYYMTIENNRLLFKKLFNYIILIIPILVMIILDVSNILNYNENLKWIINADNFLVFLYSIGVFNFIKQKYENKDKSNMFIEFISKYSFSIYVIHPFWINLIYKVLEITPLNFPIFFGVLFMFFVVLLLTMIVSIVLKKIPIVKNYI